MKVVLLVVLVLVLAPLSGATAAPIAGDTVLGARALASPIIVLGTVTQVRAMMPEDPYENYEADVTVESWLKGETPASITVRYPGPPVTMPARGTASANDVQPYRLTAGEKRVFLLDGGSLYRLAHLDGGVLPEDAAPVVAATLTATQLRVTLIPAADTVKAGKTFRVTVRLQNAGSAPASIRLPHLRGEACRLWSWASARALPDPPLQPLRQSLDPSRYVPVTLPPGASLDTALWVQASPSPRLAAAQPASLAACLYILQPDSLEYACLAAPPVTVIIAP